MTYLVLARKWRPRKFSDVIGQDHVTLTLKKAVEKERLAHAYLFSGPRGCGKTSTARLLAKVINCENRKGSEPCDVCPSCVAVNEGSHLDMIEIDGASNRGIDEIRDLREKIGYTSSQSASKIYIIDEVHMLTPQAFNALLKTLEEPPSHVYLIFATTEPHKVPATILSRCQRFNFKRLELAELSGQLERICADEKIGFDPEAILMIGRRADGSMRDAESLLDQCISAAEGRIDLDTVRRVLGLVDSQTIASLLEAISARDRGEALAIVDRVVSSGMDIEEFFLAYIEGIRNLMILSVGTGGASPGLDLTAAEVERLRKTASVFRTEDLLMLFRNAARFHREMRGSGQPRYILEAAVTDAASWESALELSELIRRIDGDGPPPAKAAPRRAESAPTRPAAPAVKRAQPAGIEDPAPIDHSGEGEGEDFEGSGPDAGRRGAGGPAKKDAPKAQVGAGNSGSGEAALAPLGGREQWERFLAQVRESKLTLGIWLMSAEVVGVEDDRLILGFSPQNRFACEMIREEKNRRYIETHLERFYGRKFIVEAGEPANIGAAGEASADKKRPPDGGAKGRDADGAKIAADVPMVDRIMKEFDGELFRE